MLALITGVPGLGVIAGPAALIAKICRLAFLIPFVVAQVRVRQT